jgi:glycosyltransferase involved in cell wall biosynthesis
MKILIVTQYFWPETFRINDLALALKERGHTVEILTGKPNYPKGKFYNSYSFFSRRTEVWNGIKIHRAPLIPRGNARGIRLMINYISFAVFCCIRGFFIKGKVDKIFVFEPSPVTVGIPALLLKWKKKAPVYFWVQDLWPHSVTAANGSSSEFLINILDNLTRWIYRKSDKILIQSEAFKEIILGQGIHPEKIIFYPNSVEDFFKVKEINTDLLKMLPEGFKIMFAGNIGESQDFKTIVEAARIVKESNSSIKWIILGDGRKKEYLERKVKELGLQNQILLLGSFPVEQMPDYFACADCLLVSLKKEYIFSLTIPSKIQSYLACGKPILASLDGEGARIVMEARAGLISEAESPLMLASKVLEFAELTKTDLAVMGNNGRLYFEANFERELLVGKLEVIFENE